MVQGIDSAPSDIVYADGSVEARSALSTFARAEKKYILAPAQYARVRALLERTCRDDDFARSTVLSLYYDDAQFTMINRSMEKPLYKQKIRVRAYAPWDAMSADPQPAPEEHAAPEAESGNGTVFVELKKKFKGVTYKRRFPASPAAARAFLSGAPYERAQADFPLKDPEKRAACLSWKNVQIAREIAATAQRYGRIEPKIMVMVDRIALRAIERSDLRITFDLNARYRTDRLDFAAGGTGAPLFDDGRVIMEVKCAKAYPLWLSDLLSSEGLYCRSCSKVGNAYTLAYGTPAAVRALERATAAHAGPSAARAPAD